MNFSSYKKWCLFALVFGSWQLMAQISVPETKRKVVVDTYHGEKVEDPYRWLEDQEAEDTRAWLAAQDVFKEKNFEKIPQQDAIYQELMSFVEKESFGIPTIRGQREFYSHRKEGEEKNRYYVKEADGRVRLLIDPNQFSENATFSVLRIIESGKLLFYGIRDGGADEMSVHILDVDSGQHLKDKFPASRSFGFAETSDIGVSQGGFYYVTLDVNHSVLKYHKMGTDISEDKVILEDSGGLSFFSLSENLEYALIIEGQGTSSSRRTSLFNMKTKKTTSLVDKYVRTNFFWAGNQLGCFDRERHDNGEVFWIDLEKPERAHWREVVPASERYISSCLPAAGHLILRYLHNVIETIEVKTFDGSHVDRFNAEEPGLYWVSGEWKAPEVFFSFTSPLRSGDILKYEPKTKKRTLWKKSFVSLDPEKYQVKQHWTVSKDGTKVPMFVMHRKDLKFDGNNPTLIVGYGGFRRSMNPYFSQRQAVWMQRGGVCVIANLRGGGEFGESWYRSGMMAQKQNTFNDLYAITEYLIEKKYTRPKKVAISGGSNGGLLVGAAVTQRPELFGAVLCSVPLLDMLRYEELLMGPWWINEYGSVKKEDEYKVLKAYSPYQNVRQGQDYPAIMFVTGDLDTRVDPMHARKMAALMQYADSTPQTPVVLKYNTKSGHSGGAKGLSDSIKKLAENVAFLLHHLGALEKGSGF